ncbi:PAS domain S-box protein [Nitrospirillum sp. BR 11164]|uniref:sensor histidine kinase n=1 Tax=Nitrospirillum sp. BR 11164 TaxID=3104324 RepID=UPI002AFF17E0|nr:histidine kinase dimerization/phosphoacceptor domain -containing protein [Nitrospirillum sp. BR 11164]MEA1647403.1 PAS domain S-box protein [Nitrospirillum sp. BR 11164]
MSLTDWLLDPSGLTPHGFCLSWLPGLIWLHAGSDAVIGLSYFSIPLALAWFVRKRNDLAYRWVGHLFVAFILACGLTHMLSILTLWMPAYGVEGMVKLVTALLSVATAAMLWPLVPRVLALPSPAQLARLNADLTRTVEEQERTAALLRESEAKVLAANSELERRVAERTDELRAANAQLTEALAERAAALEALAGSEAEYRASFEAAAVGKVQVNPETGLLLRANNAFARMLGYNRADLAGRMEWPDLLWGEDRTAEGRELARLLAGEASIYVRELRFRRQDGTPVWGRVSATLVRGAGMRKAGARLPPLLLAVVEDVDTMHKTALALRESETRLRLAAEGAKLGIWELDLARGLGWVDRRTAEVTGGTLPAETWFPLSGPEYAAWADWIHPDDRAERAAGLRLLQTGAAELVQMQYRVRRAADDPGGADGGAGDGGGGWIWLSHRSAIVARDPVTWAPTRATGVLIDVTERAEAEAALREAKADLELVVAERTAALKQRDLLLREVYHRVKNNLQIIDGLVMMQGLQLKDTDERQALMGLRSRVYALGLVHQQLMASPDLENFDIAPFLDELARNILLSGADDGVELDIDICPLTVNLDFAIPLGLLVTELITNSLKHAFPDGRGTITMVMRRREEGGVLLVVADDGDGISAPSPVEEGDAGGYRRGLGSTIVKGLVAQLDGTITMRFDKGTRAEIILPTPAVGMAGSPVGLAAS